MALDDGLADGRMRGDAMQVQSRVVAGRVQLLKGLLAVCLALAFVLLFLCAAGPDPRYLLIRKGMTQDQVWILMCGKPDYYDTSLEDGVTPAWFYCYPKTEIIVEWDPDGRVRKKIFLQSMW